MRRFFFAFFFIICTQAAAGDDLMLAGVGHIAASGGSAFALVANIKFAGQNGATSSAINTTGAFIIIINVSQYKQTAATTPTDSKSNTWTPLTAQPALTNCYDRLFYCISCTVGSGHTFSTSNGNIYSAAQVIAFSDSAGTPSFDKQSGAAASGGGNTSLAAGSVTPANPNSLIVTGMCNDYNSGNSTVTAGYTITDQDSYAAGAHFAGGIAYLIQTSAILTNPTWTPPAATDEISVTVAVFAP